ncbi:MAG: nitrous oxide-stimulated promoter family protein [Chloroflexi bacterium]|nr:nitrous oxide-stimulated promoter family protein [Chloroflexota bacterium]
MSKLFEKLDQKKARDLRVLSDFIAIFCGEKHRAEPRSIFPIKDDRVRETLGEDPSLLCQECQRLLNHGMSKLLQCTYDPKPMCKKCQTHCYAPGYREKIRKVMKFSGLYLIRHGRIGFILHYFF